MVNNCAQQEIFSIAPAEIFTNVFQTNVTVDIFDPRSGISRPIWL
jgi:hypothetical protein